MQILNLLDSHGPLIVLWQNGISDEIHKLYMAQIEHIKVFLKDINAMAFNINA